MYNYLNYLEIPKYLNGGVVYKIVSRFMESNVGKKAVSEGAEAVGKLFNSLMKKAGAGKEALNLFSKLTKSFTDPTNYKLTSKQINKLANYASSLRKNALKSRALELARTNKTITNPKNVSERSINRALELAKSGKTITNPKSLREKEINSLVGSINKSQKMYGINDKRAEALKKMEDAAKEQKAATEAVTKTAEEITKAKTLGNYLKYIKDKANKNPGMTLLLGAGALSGTGRSIGKNLWHIYTADPFSDDTQQLSATSSLDQNGTFITMPDGTKIYGAWDDNGNFIRTLANAQNGNLTNPDDPFAGLNLSDMPSEEQINLQVGDQGIYQGAVNDYSEDQANASYNTNNSDYDNDLFSADQWL